MLDELNSYTKYDYKNTIEKRKKQVLFNSYIAQNMFDVIKTPEFSDYFNQLNACQKMKLHIRQHFPKAYGLLKDLKRKWI
jgi:hypothetical protein